MKRTIRDNITMQTQAVILLFINIMKGIDDKDVFYDNIAERR